MTPLSDNDIESELSYAYVHAVASRAGMSCCVANRAQDNAGIDAKVTAWGPFEGGGYINEVDFNIQLKATTSTPADDGKHLSYFVRGRERYDDLRQDELWTPRLLVVLFLPHDAEQWLSLNGEQLILRKWAYWVSLRGAPPSANNSGETVKIPKAQVLDPAALKEIARRLSLKEIPRYEVP